MSSSLTPDQQAGCLASLQHGAITYVQLILVGLTPEEIRHRVKAGRLLRVARGVFVATGSPHTWQQDAMVACLSGPPGTVASHLTAAALLGIVDKPADPHVTVPRNGSARKGAAVVHRADLTAEDVAVIDGIPVTSPARTVVDCATQLDEKSLSELLDDILHRRLCVPKDVVTSMERGGPRRAGGPALERALDVWMKGAFPGSPAEMRLVRRLVDWGFPEPERQLKILDARGCFVARIDVGWRDRRAGLEYYGERYHGPRAEEHDAGRLDRITGAGWRVRVVTKRDLGGAGARGLRLWLAETLAEPDSVALIGALPR